MTDNPMVKYTAYIRNNETGEVRPHETGTDPEYVSIQRSWWKEGNGCCDCNRGDFWHGDGEDHEYPCGHTLFSVPYFIWEDGRKELVDDAAGD